MSKPKFRGKSCMFNVGSGKYQGFACIEVKPKGQPWRLLGDDKGVYKFTTVEARDAKIEELKKEKWQ